MKNPVLSLEKADIFQEQHLVLGQVNVAVYPGEFVYLIGKTGSGKSSLMKTLYGELPLTQGQGQIVGFDLPSLTEKQIPFLRRKIGIVFQDFKLLPDRSVYQNLRFVLRATGWMDEGLIEQAREDAETLIATDNDLSDYPALRAELAQLQRDQAVDYLDKG